MTQTFNNTGGNTHRTVAPVVAPANVTHASIPVEFIRLPKHGLDPTTGLSRAKLNDLILPTEANGYKPPVKSVCLRKVGAIRGARLIHLRSLLDYLYSNLEGGSESESATGQREEVAG